MNEPVVLTDEEIDAVSRGPCDWCGHGAEGHETQIDRYGDPVVRCLSELEDDPAVVRRHNLRLLLGGLS